jgi:carbon storage regulator
MLVLSRKKGERIMVGQSITITVVETSCGRVQLGITAPEGIAIYRDEVLRYLSTWHAGTRLADTEAPAPPCAAGLRDEQLRREVLVPLPSRSPTPERARPCG